MPIGSSMITQEKRGEREGNVVSMSLIVWVKNHLGETTENDVVFGKRLVLSNRVRISDISHSCLKEHEWKKVVKEWIVFFHSSSQHRFEREMSTKIDRYPA